MMRSSFFVVLYAEFLVIIQYIYGMHINANEMPFKVIYGETIRLLIHIYIYYIHISHTFAELTGVSFERTILNI